MLKDYINASIAFEPLAKKVGKNSKSLHRMLGPNGNPSTKSLHEIIKAIQSFENIQLKISINKQ